MKKQKKILAFYDEKIHKRIEEDFELYLENIQIILDELNIICNNQITDIQELGNLLYLTYNGDTRNDIIHYASLKSNTRVNRPKLEQFILNYIVDDIDIGIPIKKDQLINIIDIDIDYDHIENVIIKHLKKRGTMWIKGFFSVVEIVNGKLVKNETKYNEYIENKCYTVITDPKQIEFYNEYTEIIDRNKKFKKKYNIQANEIMLGKFAYNTYLIQAKL